MKTVETLFTEAIEEWRLARGVGTAIVPKRLDSKQLVLGVLQRFYMNGAAVKTLIVTDTWQERLDFIELFNNGGDEENNREFKHLLDTNMITIITKSIFDNHTSVHYGLFISYNVSEYDDAKIDYIGMIKFKLIVLSSLISDYDMRNKFYHIAPLMNSFKDNEVNELRANSPVEEVLVDVSITNNEDLVKLDRYNQYISTSVSIFGGFDIIKDVRLGDNKANISAQQVALQLAEQNGWNEHLDMSIEYNAEIDALYNPVSLRERASNTYAYIRNRASMLSDYDGKLQEIANIVTTNPTSKILIVSKRGEFASKVTEYINENSLGVCGNYHDKVLPIAMTDEKGNIITYKSGAKKGKERTMGAQAQMTRNEDLYNKGILNVLSLSNSPSPSLNVKADIVIITSPMCESIEGLIYRLSQVQFAAPLKLYTLYIKDTLEEKLLAGRTIGKAHKVLNGIKNVVACQTFGDFPIVD